MSLETNNPPHHRDQPVKTPLYEASTQFKNWRFSNEQLASTRMSLNEAAVAAIRANIEATEPGSSMAISFLTPDEEQLLVKLYITKVSELCAIFRFPEEVEATAVTYLKRFYLKNTVMDWHPKNVMLTALFLATKTTNNPISLEAYAKHIPRTTPSDILDLEFLVAQSLGFEFAVWHAHRALWGMWLDFQGITDGKLDIAIYDAALVHIRTSRLTDVEFVYTPSQIALAALFIVAPEVSIRWLNSKVSPNPSTPSLSTEALQTTVEEIKTVIIATVVAPDINILREVDRRLKLCKNPEKVVGSKAYLAKQAEEERNAEEKRNRKADGVRKAMHEADPFGNTLTREKPGLVDYDDDDDDD